MIKRRDGFLATIIRYRELIFFLVYREFRVRYKQTLLGISWAVLQPFSQMVVFTVVFFHFAKFKSEGLPYPIFVLAGLLPWSMFQAALTRGVPIFLNYQSIITKIYFPRIVLLIVATVGLAIDFVCAFGAFLVVYMYFGLPLHAGLLASLCVIVVQVFLTVGFLCFGSIATVFFRDLNYAVPLVLQLWMFSTPVVYSLDAVPERFRFWYDLNPMVGLVHTYRQILLQGTIDWQLFIYACASSILIFIAGYSFLKANETNLADSV